jgi:hypothetical protein
MSVVYLQKQQVVGVYIVSILGVIIDGVWIGEWIYWPLVYTAQNYILQITDTD